MTDRRKRGDRSLVAAFAVSSLLVIAHDPPAVAQDRVLPPRIAPKAPLVRDTVQQRLKSALFNRAVPIPARIDRVSDGLAALSANGYAFTHGWTVFKGEGLAFAQPHAAMNTGALDPAKPTVVLYRNVNAKTDAELSDQSPDPPYELIGVGWFKEYAGAASSNQTPTEAPPSELSFLPPGVFPQGSWFRHTAGCHMSNGEFVAFRENLPALSLGMQARMAQGTAWCQAIGTSSRWQSDGAVEPGARGRCLLDRNTTAPLPRPLVPGSFATMNAPAISLPRPPDPGSAPAEPTMPAKNAPPNEWTAYTAAKTKYLADKATHDARAKSLSDWRAAVQLQANAKCQSVGSDVTPPNAPTFWHGMAWDTHVFFRPDGTVSVGINDLSLVPNGYSGPPESFPPMTAELHVVR